MLRVIKKIQYFYSSSDLCYVREKYNLRVCFKNKSLQFLKKHDLISKNLSNRITIRSNFIRSYKQLKYFYIEFLRDNFIKNRGVGGKNILRKNTINNNDMAQFNDYYNLSRYTFNDLDRVLVWRAVQVNSMFKLIQTEKKNKKKYVYKSRLQFIDPSKRILVVWKWLSVFIRAFSIKDKKWKEALLPSFENFLITKQPNHIITDIKLQIYKIKLLRTV